MAVQRVTKRLIDSLKSTKRDLIIWDTEVRNFGVRFKSPTARNPDGLITYVLNYQLMHQPPRRRYTIGAHGHWTPDSARRWARELLEATDRGIRPNVYAANRVGGGVSPPPPTPPGMRVRTGRFIADRQTRPRDL